MVPAYPDCPREEAIKQLYVDDQYTGHICVMHAMHSKNDVDFPSHIREKQLYISTRDSMETM